MSTGQISDASYNLLLFTAFGNTHESFPIVKLWAGQIDGYDLIETV